MIEQQLKNPNSATTAQFPTTQNSALRLVFMGTPEFAVASLDKLVQAGFNIVAVVTAPDKAAGRGMKLQQSAVKKYAVEKGLTVLQPEKLKAPEFIDALRKLRADLQIVVAFRMLPEVVWSMPPMGTVNLHGSLLPQYRGAAPINWAIINGESSTGVTTFRLQHVIDTGDILLQATIPIGENQTAGDLHDIMMETGADLLLKTIRGLEAGTLAAAPQSSIAVPELELNHAPKLFTEHCQVDWNQTATRVYNLIRGLSPYPAAFSFLEGKKCKIFKAVKINKQPTVNPGEVESDRKTFLRFACLDDYLEIMEIQLEGKKRMTIADFLRGYRWNESGAAQ